MRNLRTIGACIVAAFALSAVGAATASAAEPAVMQCAKAKKEGKTYLGHYSSKKCEPSSYHAEGGQKYELEEWNVAGKGGEKKVKEFKGKGGGANLEINGVGAVECSQSADIGRFTGPQSVGKITVAFTGCLLETDPCSNTTKAGEVKTNLLDGTVGFISKAKEEVGLELKPETGLYAAEFKCGELKLRVSGAVIGLVKPPYNVFTKSVTLVFEQANGIQGIHHLEGGPEAQLYTEVGGEGPEYGEPKLSGESTESTSKGEELELRA